MRTLTDHIINSVNGAVVISVLDEPGQDGASHEYEMRVMSSPAAESDPRTLIKFQNGPIKEFGVNGVTQEALLTVIIDRLRSFQAGKFACRENAVALTHCEDALMWLQKRTRERLSRGVEGTNQK